MEGLKTLTTAGLLIALPMQVLSDFRALDDAAMGDVTAQAGITIDLETEMSIRRLEYRDQGSLMIDSIHLTDGDFTGMLDNLQMKIDIAGDSEVLTYGFSELAERGANGTISSSDPSVADAMSKYDQGGAYGRTFDDGDAVIHIGATDYGNVSSISDFVNAVDFGLTIDQIGIVDTARTQNTSLFSNISIQGRLGPTDIVIHNSGSTKTLANGNQVAEGGLELNSYFAVDDMDVNWDIGDVLLIFNLGAVGIENMQINNRYGADAGMNFGMASLHASAAKGVSATTGVEGLQIHDLQFKGDILMPTFRIGDKSIGSVNFIDFAITDTSALVYGH
ncbi:DUF6160 family protein [Marinobacteraceae bacterium S3BR75-40.1]